MVKKVYSIDDLEDYLGGEDEPALFKGKPFTGVLVEDREAWDYYKSPPCSTQTSEDLRLRWETTFKKGEEVCCNIYSDSGMKVGEIRFKNRKEVFMTAWYLSGRKKAEIDLRDVWEDDKKDGVYEVSWDENGEVTFKLWRKGEDQYSVSIERYKNGQKKNEIHKKNGSPFGLSTEWYFNGKKKKEISYK